MASRIALRLISSSPHPGIHIWKKELGETREEETIDLHLEN